MRFLKFLIILPFIIYGGIKGYIWYDIKSNMDKFTQSISPFVEVTYGSIFSSMSGEIGVEKIVIRPKITDDVFQIQSVSLSAPSIIDIMKMGSRMRNKRFPEYVGIHVKQMKVDLDSKLFAMLEKMQKQSGKATNNNPIFIQNIDALGCGDIEKFGARELVSMGANPLNVDLDMILKYQEVARNLKVDMNIQESDRYHLKIASVVPFDPDNVRSSVRPSEFPIKKTEIEYTDSGLYKLRNQYCAKQIGGSVNDYIEAHISRVSQELGAVLPSKTIDAYHQYMLNGGRFNMTLNPVNDILLTGLQFYKPADVLSLLGAEMAINDVPVDLEQIQWNDQGSKPQQKNEARNTTAKNSSGSLAARMETPKQKPAVKEVRYRSIKISHLSRYVGKKVQVHTANGRQKQGILESVDEDRIRILVKFGSGNFSFPVKVAEITDASVYM